MDINKFITENQALQLMCVDGDDYEVIYDGIEKAIAQRDAEILEWAKDHYWDSLEDNKDLIIKHLETYLNHKGKK